MCEFVGYSKIEKQNCLIRFIRLFDDENNQNSLIYDTLVNFYLNSEGIKHVRKFLDK